jgi:tetratricopeptide (TPR) repeat protein
MIGPYKLLQQIGEGGMGTVFMAEQTAPVQRKVALKIIKPGMDSRQVIARFEAERQALALMEHPHIAKVFDAGTTGAGRPFFVMELVKGVPITRYCDGHRLTPKERLELFVPVCQAVQHAHLKGVIHRDLKPSNVLVAEYDDKPVPKVIDFGVAKAAGPKLTERTMFTELGQLVGTLEYMSPEQAKLNALDIDTRSDIYALGVLLYELLTGTTPVEKNRLHEAAFDEMLRIIREEEPQKPSTRLSSTEELPSIAANRGLEPNKLSGLIRGELDWIVMKALEKDRNRRYETASSLAMDVQRYLADEPVQACPPSVGYRVRKFVRRNKRSLSMAAIVAGALLALVGAVGWMVRDRTAREQGIAHDRATRQAVIQERVTMALEEVSKRHQEGRWREALDAAKRAEALAATAESDAETYQHAREVLGDMQMLAELEEVRVRSTRNEEGFDLEEEDRGSAGAFREYGIDIDALELGEAAARIRARPIRYELAALLDSWSHVRRRLVSQGSKQVGKNWMELLEIARAADPDPWRDRFRKAVLNSDRKALVKVAASAPVSSLPAETVDRLGDALMGTGCYQEAVAFLKKGQQAHPQDYWINANLGICLSRLGPKRLDEAIRYYTAALALRPEAAKSHSNLGEALKAQGRLDEARECDRKVLEIYSQACEQNPKEAKYWHRRGALYAQLGQHDKAACDYSQAINLSPESVFFWNARGGAFYRLKQWDKALVDFTKASELNPKQPTIAHNRGNAHFQLGQFDKAITDYSRAIDLRPNHAASYRQRARAYERLKRRDEAIADYSKVIELKPLESLSWNQRGSAYFALEQWDKALADYTKATALNPKDATCWINRGSVYRRLREYDKAIDDFSKAIDLDPENAKFWHLRAHAKEGLRQWKESLADHAKAIELAPEDPQLHVCRGRAYAELEDWQKAAEAFERAITLKPEDPRAWYHLALLDLQRGDCAGYRKVCSKLLDRIDQPASRDDVYWIASTCILAPDGVADWTKLVKLVEKVEAGNGKDYDSITNLGAVLYRAGRFQEAAQRLTEADAAFAQTPRSRNTIIYNWLFQTMAQSRLGHAAEAAGWIDIAVRAIDEPSQEAAQDATTNTWNRRLTLQMLRREAEELMKKNPGIRSLESAMEPD